MAGDEAGWRKQNAGSVLSSATALFERDVLSVVQSGEFHWVTRVYLALFRHIDLDGTRLTELALRASVTKQSMQELVDKAEAFGVVERRPAPGDGRAKMVAFTPAGLRMLERFRAGVAEAERRLAGAVGPEFLAQVRVRLTDYAAGGEAGVARGPGEGLVRVEDC